MSLFKLFPLFSGILFLFLLKGCFAPDHEHKIAQRAWNDWPGENVIVVYAENKDSDLVKNILEPVKNDPLLKLIVVVDYLGCESDSLKKNIEAWDAARPIEVINQFDGSVYAIMPLSKTPAFYLINKSKIAVGPIYGPQKFLRLWKELN